MKRAGAAALLGYLAGRITRHARAGGFSWLPLLLALAAVLAWAWWTR